MIHLIHTFLLLLLFILVVPVTPVGAQQPLPLLLRAESLAVLPQSQPMLYVQVANTGQQAMTATISVQLPSRWPMADRSQVVQIAGGATERVGFSLSAGNERQTNEYPIEMTARVGDTQVVRQQLISVASAPYFKPTIDGDISDWKDAIPVSFETKLQHTTIATFWNRRRFSILVSVEEASHKLCGTDRHFDAIQFALAPRGTETSRSPDDEATRFEYLVYTDAAGKGVCCQLMRPGWRLADATRPRSLTSLVDASVEVAVSRSGSVTHYELSLPLTEIRKRIRPGEGREFYLGVLVHDPDGTGLRDWGVAAGMWQRQRNRLAWSDWEGAQWGDEPPMDCRTEWGMCSSRY